MKSDPDVVSRARSGSRATARASQPATDEQPVNYGRLPTIVGHHVRKANSYLFQTFTEALGEIGLPPNQYSALTLIGLNPGLSQMTLADVAGMDRTTVVPITNRFAKAGWIQRIRQTQDRRLYSLSLTPKGEAILATAKPLVEAHERRFFKALSPSERARLRVLLTRIADLETADRSTPASRRGTASHKSTPRSMQRNSRESQRIPATPPEPPIDFGPLPQQTGYALRKAYSYLFRTFMATFKPLKLAPGQFSTLVLIGANPGMSQLALAAASGLDGSTIVPITNRFEILGWIRRTRRPDDRRVYSLDITPAGQEVLDQAWPLIARRESKLAAILNTNERRALIDMLSRVSAT